MSIIRVECVRNVASLESLSSDFIRLSAGAAMQRLSWLLPWWEAYQANYKLHVLVGFRGENVCGIFPLVESTSALTGRSLVLMGSGKACSDNLGILVEDVDSEPVANTFADWLVNSPDCCRWDLLNLDGIRESNRAMAHFSESMQALAGTQIQRKESPNCWSVSLAGGFDAFKSRLTKRASKIVRQAESAMDSGKAKFEIARTQKEALEFITEIERMHQARWQERGIDGCFSTSEFSRFLRGAIERMWDDPWHRDTPMTIPPTDCPFQVTNHQRVQVALLRIDGVVAAGAICFGDTDALAMYLVGMNPDFAQDRPGWILNTCAIRYAIELGCARFDFLRGDEEYKQRLGAVPTVQKRWLIPSRRVTSQVRNVAYRTAVLVKELWSQTTVEQPSQPASN